MVEMNTKFFGSICLVGGPSGTFSQHHRWLLRHQREAGLLAFRSDRNAGCLWDQQRHCRCEAAHPKLAVCGCTCLPVDCRLPAAENRQVIQKKRIPLHSGLWALPGGHLFENSITGTSLVVQWLRRHTPSAGGTGLIPGQGTKSLMPQLKMPQLRPGAAK